MATDEPQPLGEILTVDEVAGYLRVSRATVCRWCGSGKLPAFKIGKGWRVQRGELEGFIRSQREHTPALVGPWTQKTPAISGAPDRDVGAVIARLAGDTAVPQ
jgi:excisionase family DNA binding protein